MPEFASDFSLDWGSSDPLSGSYGGASTETALPSLSAGFADPSVYSLSSPYTPAAAEPVPWYGTLANQLATSAGALLGGYTTKLLYGDQYAQTDAAIKQAAAWRQVNGSGTNDPWGMASLAPRDIVDLLTGRRQAAGGTAATSSPLMWVLIGGAFLLLILLLRR